MTKRPYKEFRVKMELRNNLLIERRERLGMSPREAGEKSGVGYSAYLNYESLKTSPISKRAEGGWKPSALKLARFYGVAPEVLWPASILLVEVRKAEREVGVEELVAITGGKFKLEEKVGA